jgi:hypothetical protein
VTYHLLSSKKRNFYRQQHYGAVFALLKQINYGVIPCNLLYRFPLSGLWLAHWHLLPLQLAKTAQKHLPLLRQAPVELN